MKHVRQLDGLRALAVGIVLLHHWIPQAYQPMDHLGRLGVLLFFVLSGYLITGILLQGRELVQSGVGTSGFVLKQFYIRRFLRIFPIYYAILIAGWLLHNNVIRETMAWDVSYTTNFYFAHRGEWQNPVTHLWSLSVEEQFYLVWPALILFLPLRALPATILGIILVAPLMRGIGSLAGLNPIAVWVLSPACLDTLGAGAFLALAQHAPDRIPGWFKGKSSWLPWIGLGVLLGVMELGRLKGDTALYLALYDTSAALIFVYLVARASRGFSGPVGRALEWEPVVYLGKISYGVYLLHLFVSAAVNKVANHLVGSHGPKYAVPLFFCYLTITLVLASLSWRYFEAPLNDLKRFFPYRQTTPQQSRVPIRSARNEA